MAHAETLGSLGETAVLARIFPLLPAASAQILGPGDDAAVVAAPDGRFVVTTDMMIHGPDFRLAWSSGSDLGWKAAASNLADIAAMGAVPTALVVAIAAPPDTPIELLEAIAEGLRDGCEAMAPGCGVVGGDLSASTVLTIAVTAFGDLEGRAPVRRTGARVGDVLAVSGELGESAKGLELMFARGVVDGEPDAAAAAALALEHPVAIAAHLRPHPPIADGKAAALAGATSMIDVSDGLALDASRIALASGVALDIAREHEPVLAGGEDHCLLATFPAGVELPGGFRPIGLVVEGQGVLVAGEPLTQRGGWDPFDNWDGRI